MISNEFPQVSSSQKPNSNEGKNACEFGAKNRIQTTENKNQTISVYPIAYKISPFVSNSPACFVTWFKIIFFLTVSSSTLK